MNIYRILFVDDEPNILQSLKRAFFDYPEFEILTAEDAEQGAGILATTKVDVLVSDEKMPKIQGSQFIQYVKERFPDVVRCILTGYSDTDSILRAINRGEVYRYLVKPWNDADLISTVRSAADYGRLLRYNRELQEQLKNQNNSLKQEVARRTEYLQKALNTAKSAREEIGSTFDGIVALLSHLVGELQPEKKEFASRTARLCERIGITLELSREEVRTVRIAALLQEIGFLERSRRPESSRGDHAQAGAELLESVSALGPVALIVKHHHEQFGGGGEPGGLKGEEIPLGSRIIKAAGDYIGLLYDENLSYEAALEKMVTGINSLYDPHIVQVLRRLEGNKSGARAEGIPIRIGDLQAGMILKNDLLLKNGALALPRNTVLTSNMVQHLPNYRLLDLEETVYLKAAAD